MERLQDLNYQIAIKASIKAGKTIMDVYDGEFGVELKADDSPLTLADRNANEVINAFLKTTPFPIISEENKQIEYTVRKKWSCYWLVDPLDGTKEFVKRNGEFTVNIALIKYGKPQFGVIYVPVTKTFYVADVSENRAYKHQLITHQMPSNLFEENSRLTRKSNESDRIRVVGSRSHMNEETTAFIRDLEANNHNVEIVSKGSSLKFCIIAEGLADVYPRFGPTMEWDTGAGQALCEAMGASVISSETNKPLGYNKENLLNPYFKVSF
ncbi:3'(2'),5'-bisphosphate nucleotidase CysQ [Winogradskyella maritima]|nr:3'(2'),5'-bisphosphate nucleotidase CysQ [Winogradskyella maritima]